MTALLLCASVLCAPHAISHPGHTLASRVQAVERIEYWLYPPGPSSEGRQKWGVVTAPTLAEARQLLEERQASQKKWSSWIGAKNDVNDDPYSFENFTGPFEVRTGTPPRVPVGINTTNVWIVGLEEITARKRAAAQIRAVRRELESAKDTIDALLPIGTQTRAAADLRGRAIFAAGHLLDAMAKVREAEVALHASQGASLADVMYEVDEVRVRLQKFLPDIAAATIPDEAPAETPTKTSPALTPTGATVLRPNDAVERTAAPDGAKNLISGRDAEADATANPTVETTKAVSAELTRRLGNPYPGRPNDNTLFSYRFDREGVTVRRQLYVDGRFQPSPPERLTFTSFPDLNQLFVVTTPRMAVAYGDPDVSKGAFQPIIVLPSGSTPEQAAEALAMVKHLVAPEVAPSPIAPSAANPAAIVAPSETEANRRLDQALAKVKIPNQILPANLVPAIVPEWMRTELNNRIAFGTDSATLAKQYSDKLVTGGQVLDAEGRAATLEALSEAILGTPWRAGAPDRLAWTVTGFEERTGASVVTLQASFVGASATNPNDRAVHGAKIREVWALTANGMILNEVRLLRAGTVIRPAAPSVASFAERHYKDAIRLTNEGLPQSALASYEAALRISPDNAVYWAQYGHALFDLGQNAESLACYRLARDLDPKNAIIIANYATVLRAIGDLPTAIAAAKQATELAPEAVWPRETYALALFESKDYVNASLQYAQAVKLAPTDARIRANYASSLLREGKKAEALVEAKAAYDAGFRGHWVFAELGIKG